MTLFGITLDTRKATEVMNNTESSFVCILVVIDSLNFILKLSYRKRIEQEKDENIKRELRKGNIVTILDNH